MNEKMSVWRLLFYLSMGVFTFWLILKVTGVIHTPVWLEYGVPLGSLVIAAFTFSQELFKSIRTIGVDVTFLKVDVAVLKTRTDTIERKLDHVETKVDHLEKKVDLFVQHT